MSKHKRVAEKHKASNTSLSMQVVVIVATKRMDPARHDICDMRTTKYVSRWECLGCMRMFTRS